MILSLKRAWSYLEGANRRMAFWVLLAMLAMPFVELFGIGAVFSFVQVISNPEALLATEWFQYLQKVFNIETAQDAIVWIGFGTLGAIIFRIVASFFMILLRAVFERSINNTLSYRVLCGYVSKPASYFADANTATLNKNILTEVATLSSGTIKASMLFISDGLNILVILAGLLYMEPTITLFAIILFGGFYGGVSFAIRGVSYRWGAERLKHADNRFRASNNVLGGIREIKILGREHVFLSKFKTESESLYRIIMFMNLISSFPRYVLETLVFSGVISLVLLLQGEGRENVVSLVSLYGIAAYRLMPSLDNLFKQITVIRSSAAVSNELDEIIRAGAVFDADASVIRERLSLNNAIEMNELSFSYGKDSEAQALSNINLSIPTKTSVAFVGPSGAGKSTLVNILIGAIEPTSGELKVDGHVVTSHNKRIWQNNIGYVPQDIFLTEDTIQNNIAFGVDEREIDGDKVLEASRLAHLHDFVTQELPDGYDTVVGERGVRLSGGQRQRIGVARALYHEPDILVLDEATSALDGITEQIVSQAIHDLNRKKTVVIIAHRLTTIRHCDVIYLLSEGQIVDSGTYDELMEKNQMFRDMARNQH